jgi:hypothetical protein
MNSELVNVHLWELGEYAGPESQLPPCINLDWLRCPLGLTIVTIGNLNERHKVWATVDISKVPLWTLSYKRNFTDVKLSQ